MRCLAALLVLFASLVANAARAEERGLTRKDKEAVWGFPDDYEKRVRAIAHGSTRSRAWRRAISGWRRRSA